MGGCSCRCCCNNYMYSCRHVYLLIWFFLLIWSSTQVRFMAEGRLNFRVLEVAKVGDDGKVMVRAQIGSRPPRCEGMCSSCGHCEAVQVPVSPKNRTKRRQSSKASTVSTYRGEYSSNYKPMSWKCKCGDRIFNP